jgi:hypothetical protein
VLPPPGEGEDDASLLLESKRYFTHARTHALTHSRTHVHTATLLQPHQRLLASHSQRRETKAQHELR